MRLNFNVLWIDDQPALVKSSQDALSRRMASEGFLLRPFSAVSIEASNVYLSDDVLLDEIDLILVDYDLGGGVTGDDALLEIRDKIPYRDIIFYSANASKDLKDKAYKQGIEGVYCASRDDLVDTALGVFEVLIKKALDIDHMRGIVMGATSEIDIIVHDCLLAINAQFEDGERARLLEQARKRVGTKFDDFGGRIKVALARESLEDLLQDRCAFTADSKLGFLIRLLKDSRFAPLDEKRVSVVEYNRDIIPSRNILAHARLIPENGAKVFQGKDGRVISSDAMRDLRISLVRHRDMFAELLAALQGRGK